MVEQRLTRTEPVGQRSPVGLKGRRSQLEPRGRGARTEQTVRRSEMEPGNPHASESPKADPGCMVEPKGWKNPVEAGPRGWLDRWIEQERKVGDRDRLGDKQG